MKALLILLSLAALVAWAVLRRPMPLWTDESEPWGDR